MDIQYILLILLKRIFITFINFGVNLQLIFYIGF